MSNNVWKLLRRNISVSQIVGYAIANLVGLSIIIAAVQFYGDTSEAISGEDSFLSKDYVIISKKVSALIPVFRSHSRPIPRYKSQGLVL